jgi:phosphotransferase system enzyme I (PtsI)
VTSLTARGVSPGIAVGRAVLVVRDARQVRYKLAASGVERERHRLRSARERTRVELEEISERIARTVGRTQAAIFAAQLLMLDDPLLVGRADELIRTERINGDWALERAIGEVHAVFARDGDSWLADRAGDLADVGGRVQRNLRPGQDSLAELVQELEPPLVLIADELPPSAAAQLDWTRVRGVVADIGSPTNHTVILMRSLGIPAVVGLSGATQMVAPDQTVALDGTTGEVVVDPSDDALAGWHRRAATAASAVRALQDLRDRPAMTADGVRIRLEANLEIAEDVDRVRESGAEGIGLYRSEFLLDVLQPGAASESAQCDTYRALLAAMRPLPVTIRTFDAGEDRWTDSPRGGVLRRERFGLRGIRAGLAHDQRFRPQIRALLRSADAGVLRILLPFVTSGEELRQARVMIAEIGAEIGMPVDVPIGAMIEVPAAALTVDHLARHCSFLSVGTNDLIQYTLAVDRTDERLAGHYDPAAPAVLRLLRSIAAAGRRAGCDLSVCGEMAADPLLVALLVGLGFRTFSMTSAAIPVVKRALATIDSREARRAVRRALSASTSDAVHAILAPMAAVMQRAAIDTPLSFSRSQHE